MKGGLAFDCDAVEVIHSGLLFKEQRGGGWQAIQEVILLPPWFLFSFFFQLNWLLQWKYNAATMSLAFGLCGPIDFNMPYSVVVLQSHFMSRITMVLSSIPNPVAIIVQGAFWCNYALMAPQKAMVTWQNCAAITPFKFTWSLSPQKEQEWHAKLRANLSIRSHSRNAHSCYTMMWRGPYTKPCGRSCSK